MKKILFCCPYLIDSTLGGAKVYIEAANSLKNLGWDVKIISPDDLGTSKLSQLPEMEKLSKYSIALNNYLIKNSHLYDVIEYEHLYLPFPRSNYAQKTLMVARSILLTHQFTTFSIPHFSTLRSLVGKYLKKYSREREFSKKLSHANLTFAACDFINVPNHQDKEILIKFNIDEKKIRVLPYGLTNQRFLDLSNSYLKSNKIKNEIAFVGTFDLRKGAKEFPDIIRNISNEIPDVIFKLLGTSAMFPTKESILSYMPKDLHKYLDIIPKFSPQDLPDLLTNSKLGIFPSHMESFGFGILEMMAAGIPVVAYEVPGPDELLPKSLLVKRGDHCEMAKKIIALLKSNDFYNPIPTEMIAKAKTFSWENTAIETNKAYLEFIRQKANA